MTTLFLAALLLAGAAPVGAAPQESSATQVLVRSAVSAGGGTSASSSHSLTLTIGEEVTASTAASSTRLIRPGLQQIAAFPGVVTDLAVRSDVTLTSMTATWSSPGLDGPLGALPSGTSYFLRVASYTVPDTFTLQQAQVVVSTQGVSPGTADSAGATGLIHNTVYTLRLWTMDLRGNVSTASAAGTGSTLADAPTAVASPFLSVYSASVTVRWAALPSAPEDATSEGYTLEASSTNFGALSPGGVISSSSTADVLVSTLTVSDPALVSDRLYYFRVASLNWDGRTNYTLLGSVKTAFEAQPPLAVEPVYTSISTGSIVANWDRNGNPSYTRYDLNASADAGFSTFSSSQTFNVFAATTTLSPNTTYYFRVNATSDTSSSNYTDLGSTMTYAYTPATAASTFSSVGPHAMTVTWLSGGNPVNASSYSVVLTTEPAYPNGDAGNVNLTTSPAGTPLLSGTFAAAAPNTTYYAFVASLNSIGAPSPYAALGSTLTPAAAPLAATPGFADPDAGGFSAIWDPDGNPLSVTTYTVEASTSPTFDAGTAYSVSFDTVPDAPSVSFTGLEANTTYFFRIRAQDFLGRLTAYSELGSTSTRPSPPSGLNFAVVDPTPTSIRLDWTDAVNGPGTGYLVNVSTASDFGSGAAVTTHTVFTTFLSTAGLSVNTTYFLRAAAIGNDGVPSASVDASTPTRANAPAAAAQTFTGVGQSSFSVLWSANGNPVSVTTYTVHASTASDFNDGVFDEVSFTTAPAGASPSATFTGLNSGTTYYFRVDALSRAGSASAFTVLGATSTRASGPGAPAAVAASASALTVSWTPVTGAGYEIRASSTDFGALSPGGAVAFSSAAGGGLSSLDIGGLLANTTYYLRVGAYDWGGNATEVVGSSASTLAPAVTGTKVYQVNATSVTVNWVPLPSSPQASSGEGYVLEASTAASLASPSDFTGVVFSSINYGVQPATLTVTGLDAGTTYSFRVGVYNWAGAVDYASASQAITPVSDYAWNAGSGLWNTATNWTPNGVPSAGSRVTIDRTATVTASGNAISFFTLTLGDSAGTFAPVLVVSTSIAKARDLTVHKGATFTQGVGQTLTFSGDATFETGSTLNHSINGTTPQSAAVAFEVGGSFTMQAGATASVSGMGFNGGAANGGSGVITGGGGGVGSSASSAGGSGAGHGGAGGSEGVNAGGVTYDSYSDPTLVGSGGGGGDRAGGGVGGQGGGAVIVHAATMQFDGLITADGAVGGGGGTSATNRGAGGGGSGGTVNLSADYFVGSGTITALGGAGGDDVDFGDDPGGGGGGGRVAVGAAISGSVCDLTVTVTGGAPGTGGTGQPGDDGTLSSTSTFQAPASFAGVSPTSTTVQWTWSAAANAKNYQVMATTGGAVTGLLGPSTLSYLEDSLLANTTYSRYVRVSGCGSGANSAVAERSTLAAPPTALPLSFPGVQADDITAAWAAYDYPQDVASEGYVLEASSTNFGALTPGGVVLTSATAEVLASTLTVVFPPLNANTTYYFRVAALNWAGEYSSYTVLGATSTLAFPPTALSEDFLGVFPASVTVQWAGLPLTPQEASAEGFVVEASTTDFGALSPGGVISSSATEDPRVSTLTVEAPALITNQLYYFRVGAVNWNGVVNYTHLGSTLTPLEMQTPAPDDPLYTDLSSASIVAHWLRNGNPDSTHYALDAAPDAGFTTFSRIDTFSLFAATNTLSANTTYWFRVRAASNTSVSGYADLGSTMTYAYPPAVYGGSYYGIFAHQLSLDWLDGGNPLNETTYTVTMATSSAYPNGDAANVNLSTRPAGALPSATLAVTPNTTYYGFVSAWNDAGALSAPLAAGQIVTPAATPLSAVSTFTGVTSDGFTAIWDADGNPVVVTTYTVEASTSPTFDDGTQYSVSFDTAVEGPAATFTGLNANTTYFFRVQAANHSGDLTPFTALGATVTLAGTPAAAVSGVHFSSLTVSWTPVGAIGYELRASSTDFGALLPGGAVAYSSAAGGGTSSLPADGLDANTTYYLRLTAFNWNSFPTTVEVSSTSTLATLPAGVTLVQVNATSATVSWTPHASSPQSATAEGYIVQAATAASVAAPSDFTGTVFSSVTYGLSLGALTVTGLDAGSTYTFRVGALNWADAHGDAVAGSGVTAVSDYAWNAGSGLWDTGTNWTPNGVPSAGSRVTIDANATVTANGNAVRFFTLTLGDAGGTFAPTLVVSTAVANARDMIVYKNATFTQDAASAYAFTGDVTFHAGSLLNHTINGADPQTSLVDFDVAGTFTMEAGATAAVSGLGFNGGAANGASGVILGGGGGIGNSASSAGGSGAGHGGAGGGEGANPGGATYDSYSDPRLVGSGGGGGDRTGGGAGGQGGGAVIVHAATMQFDGLIAADGAVGGGGGTASTTRGAGGGGSGGTVNLSADYFVGSGTITVLGGAGGDDVDFGDDPGGGGGGGRVAVGAAISGSVCDLTVTVTGGAAGAGGTGLPGDDGTVSSTSTFQAPGSFAGVSPTSATIQWTWALSANAKTYQVMATTGGAVSGLLGPSAVSFLETGLLANTTYSRYVRAGGCGSGADSASADRSTLAAPPTALANSFLSMGVDQAVVAWAAMPASPQEATSEGFTLEASSTNFGALLPGGVVSTVDASNPALSTLTVATPALDANTTYYFRVAALNWSGDLSSYTVLGATATLAQAPSPLAYDYLAVYETSAAVRWAALPASPADATSEGYILQASTTNFGAALPGGVTISSITRDVAVTTLTISGLDLGTTVFMRVGSLNHGQTPNFLDLLRLNIQIFPSIVDLHLGAMDPSVSMSTVSVSSYVITNIGTLPLTFGLSATTATAESPWILGSSPDIETVVLQGLWNSVQPPSGSFVTPIVNSTTTSAGGNYAGDETGITVLPGQSRTLWFRFQLPSTTATSTFTQTMKLGVAPSYP